MSNEITINYCVNGEAFHDRITPVAGGSGDGTYWSYNAGDCHEGTFFVSVSIKDNTDCGGSSHLVRVSCESGPTGGVTGQPTGGACKGCNISLTADKTGISITSCLKDGDTYAGKTDIVYPKRGENSTGNGWDDGSGGWRIEAAEACKVINGEGWLEVGVVARATDTQCGKTVDVKCVPVYTGRITLVEGSCAVNLELFADGNSCAEMIWHPLPCGVTLPQLNGAMYTCTNEYFTIADNVGSISNSLKSAFVGQVSDCQNGYFMYSAAIRDPNDPTDPTKMLAGMNDGKHRCLCPIAPAAPYVTLQCRYSSNISRQIMGASWSPGSGGGIVEGWKITGVSGTLAADVTSIDFSAHPLDGYQPFMVTAINRFGSATTTKYC